MSHESPCLGNPHRSPRPTYNPRPWTPQVKPPSACQLTDAFLGEYPWLRSRHRFAEGDLSDLVPGERGPSTLMVSLHGCGRLSDRVIELAHTSKASLALMPCCQNIAGMAQSLTISSHPRGDGAIDHVRRMAKRTSVADAVDAARVATMRYSIPPFWADFNHYVDPVSIPLALRRVATMNFRWFRCFDFTGVNFDSHCWDTAKLACPLTSPVPRLQHALNPHR
jgi:hypothetical protein